MKELKPSSQFRKDIKRIRNNPQKSEILRHILNLLENEIPIPAEFRPHMLTGDYKGCMECHIQNDLLLIWFDLDAELIELLRLGSHSELFGKGIKR